MTFFTQDENKNLVESVSKIMAQRKAGANLPDMVREAAIEAGKATVGKTLEERRQIMHHFFNASTVEAQVQNKAFRPTNETVNQFNEVATNSRSQHEAAQAAGSFEDVADDPGSPLSPEDRARLNKRKVKEGAEGAGSFEDVADDEGSPLTPEQRKDLNKRKVREAALEQIANFGGKQKKFPPDKDKDGKVNEAQDTSGTDKELEDVDAKERKVSVKAQTVRDIDSVPVSDTHSFVKESWTALLNPDDMPLGEQHLLAGKLVEQDSIIEASAACASNRQPFTVAVKGETEREAIENLVAALENVGSRLSAEHVLVAHKTPE